MNCAAQSPAFLLLGLLGLLGSCGTTVVAADLVSRRLPYPSENYEQSEELGGGLPAQRVYYIIHNPADPSRTATVTCSIDVNSGIARLGFGPGPSRECRTVLPV